MERRAEDKLNLSPHRGLYVAPPRVQDPSLSSPLDGFLLSLGTEWRVYRKQFLRPVHRRHLLSLTRSQSRQGALHLSLSQPYHSPGATLFHAQAIRSSYATSRVIRCQEPRRGRSLYAPEGGVIQLSLGFSLSRHRSKLVPES